MEAEAPSLAGPSTAPAPPSETIYANNLNEKIKLDVMKQSLRTLFKQYGAVLDVVAHRSVRMRGQAFISMVSVDAAAKAVAEVNKFPLYGKPMQLSFARTESDAVVKRKHPQDMETHKEERLKRKKVSQRDNPLRRKQAAKREAAEQAAELAAKLGDAAPPLVTRRVIQSIDEYLAPNKILFIQNLADEMDKDGLERLFRVYPNLVEVRMIAGRKGIAFVEYADEDSSSTAKVALHNTKYGAEDLKMKVTFAKQ